MTGQERDGTIHQMSVDIALIKQAIMGNGTKGLEERVSDLETDSKGRAKASQARLALQMSGAAVLLAGITLVSKLLKWW
jgi:hypothetical protein